MQQAVVKSKLIGNVALKFHRAFNGSAHREEQMVMVIEINHRADIKSSSQIGKICLIRSLVIDLYANEHIGQNLLLQHRSAKTPIASAGKRIKAVAGPAVGRPRTPTLLYP